MCSKNRWYLVRLKPNGFKRAVFNLNSQNVRTFMPLASRLIRSRKRYIEKKLPLFPGYLFISFDTDAVPWRSINSTYGVSRVVTFGNQAYQFLPEELISGLKARCDKGNCLLPPSDLKVGEKIKIISGPFADYIATIETIPSETRLGILFDCLGNKTSAKVKIDNVERMAV